ncbi:MAG: hypothetical protein F4138_05840 [Acidimicrobiia bacterium]|nr:hypothetical protein [Acidimicrobiia bacterium]MYC57294.1 hypothetical protein [Acidimicrobiia bacterium]MYG94497.1 hypothetical protein [Acidimicrobiia bacterium]MYI30995.1 hypothetical protein [Acidimicrobiia bacterium]
MSTDNLEAQARQFASDISDLLNNTVTQGIRISTATTPGGRAVIERSVTAQDPKPDPISISSTGKKAVVFLYLLHSYEFDPENIYLTMTQSTMSLYTSAAMHDDQLVVGIDYARNPKNQFPGAHLHVAGNRDDLDTIYLGDKRKTRKLLDLHFPVGGKRFLPNLEDLVEFMVTEKMVKPHPGWKQEVKTHRARWETIQLKAAVRRNQQDAAATLREAGWIINSPEQQL